MITDYTYHELFRAAREMLRSVDGDNADFTAQQLVAAATGRTAAQLVADYTLQVFPRDIDRVNELVRRHYRGEPLAYILGQWDFHGLTLRVTPDVLIPRDDTEAVCSLAVTETKLLDVSGPRVLDLCAGSGCIGLAVAREVADAKVTLAELSPAAIRVAKRNIQENRLSGRVTCIHLDVREAPPPFLGKYDVIVSNPPYVTTAEMETLDKSVKDYEPSLALWGGDDGLDFYRAIIKNFTPILKPGGAICLEFGMGQEKAVCRLLMDHGYALDRLVRDSGERARAVLARKPKEETSTYGKAENSL